MKVVDLDRIHLQNLKTRDLELEDVGRDLLALESDYLDCEYKKAIVDGDNVVVIMGGKVEDRMCRTWLLASDLMYSAPIATMRLIKRLHKESVKEHDINLFYTFNLPAFDREVRFVEALGYKNKGLYDDFDDGKKRILFVMEVL